MLLRERICFVLILLDLNVLVIGESKPLTLLLLLIFLTQWDLIVVFVRNWKVEFVNPLINRLPFLDERVLVAGVQIGDCVVFKTIFEIPNGHEKLTSSQRFESCESLKLRRPWNGVKGTELAYPNAVARAFERGISDQLVGVLYFD